MTGGPSVVSIFSGCGGLDVGFKEHGFDLVYACDNDPAAVACYKHNLDSRAFLRDVTSAEFRRDIDAIGRTDVVLGGFPCQGFSKAGPKRADDPRNDLYRQMKETISALRPRVFIAENVDGISQNFGGVYLDQVVRDLGAVGYRVEYRLVDAAAYGVPQHRRRIFFVGIDRSSDIEFAWPRPSHDAPVRNGEYRAARPDDLGPLFDPNRTSVDALPPSRTIADAIGDLLDLGGVADHQVTHDWPAKYEAVFRAIGPGRKLCNVRHAPTSVYTWQVPEVFGEVTPRQVTLLETISRHRRHKRYGNIPNGNPLPLDEIERLTGLTDIEPDVEALLAANYLKPVNGGYDLKGAMFCSGLFKRPAWGQAAPTVLTNFDNPRYFLHPLRDRPFSLRECARIQSFPDSFTFSDGVDGVSLSDGYRLVGNAVPPRLSAAFARSVAQVLCADLNDEERHSLVLSLTDFSPSNRLRLDSMLNA